MEDHKNSISEPVVKVQRECYETAHKEAHLYPDCFAPFPLPTYLNNAPEPTMDCSRCLNKYEYDSFLISEYGMETYLRVKREEIEREEKWKEFKEKLNNMDFSEKLIFFMNIMLLNSKNKEDQNNED